MNPSMGLLVAIPGDKALSMGVANSLAFKRYGYTEIRTKGEAS
jgi:hypothetical protein